MTEPDLTNHCEICGEQNAKTFEEHHIVPRRYGGSDNAENIVKFCSNCHSAVERIWDDDFYNRLQRAQNNISVNAVDDGDIGVEISELDTPDRTLPIDTPHVRGATFDQSDDGVDNVIGDIEVPDECDIRLYFCGYCDRAFKPYNQAKLATHLQRKHGIENPYQDRSQYKYANPHTETMKLPEQLFKPSEDETEQPTIPIDDGVIDSEEIAGLTYGELERQYSDFEMRQNVDPNEVFIEESGDAE